MSSLLRIAFRNVLRNRRRSVITFSAIFVTLAVIVTVRGFLNGLHSSIRESVVLGQTGALQIHRRGFLKSINGSTLDRSVPSDPVFLARVTSVPGVTAATPRIAFGGMINANDVTTVALWTAIDPMLEPRVCPRHLEMISSGKTLADSGPASGVLAPELAASIGLPIGHKATLLASDKDGVLNALELEFVGAYGQPGTPVPEKKFGFVPLGFAQELLRLEGHATELAVAVDRIDDVETLKPLVQAAVGPDYEVSSWHDVAPWVDEAIAAQNVFLNLVASVFLFVALVGIANTMLMSVFERTREIGTMMSLGIRRRQILALFLLEAALLGLAGGMLGAAAGTGFVLHFARSGVVLRIGDASLHIHPWVATGHIALTLALATGGAVSAALWPSLRASRLRPVEALASV